MKVTKSFPSDRNDHRIEIGFALWDESEPVVRSRWTNSAGGFNPRASSQVSMSSLCLMVRCVAEEDMISPPELARAIQAMSASLARQLGG